MQLRFVLCAALLGLSVPLTAQAHEDEHPERVVPRYPSYPYAKHTKGYVRRVPQKESGGDDAKLWSVRMAAEAGYLGPQGYRVGGRALLRYWRLGVAADAHAYGGWGNRPAFYLGTFNWTLDLIARPHFGLRTGPGVVLRTDAELPVGRRPEVEYGSNVMTEMDIIPLHPVVASARFDVGRLGDDAAVTARISLGVMIRRFELTAAYEAKRIGDTTLRGPQIGLRGWF